MNYKPNNMMWDYEFLHYFFFLFQPSNELLSVMSQFTQPTMTVVFLLPIEHNLYIIASVCYHNHNIIWPVSVLLRLMWKMLPVQCAWVTAVFFFFFHLVSSSSVMICILSLQIVYWGELTAAVVSLIADKLATLVSTENTEKVSGLTHLFVAAERDASARKQDPNPN